MFELSYKLGSYSDAWKLSPDQSKRETKRMEKRAIRWKLDKRYFFKSSGPRSCPSVWANIFIYRANRRTRRQRSKIERSIRLTEYTSPWKFSIERGNYRVRKYLIVKTRDSSEEKKEECSILEASGELERFIYAGERTSFSRVSE